MVMENNMRKIVYGIVTMLLIMSLVSCKSNTDSTNTVNNENTTDKEMQVEDETQSKIEDDQNTEKVESTSSLSETVKEIVKKLDENTYDVDEIETGYTQEHYLKLVGETIPGKVLVVNTTEDKNYEEYQQFVPINDEVYYVVHDKFFKDQQSYQDYVDAIKDDRTYSVPMIMDKSALYIQLLEYVELQAVEGTPYDRALKNVNISIANGRDWKIIGKAE